MATTTLHGRGGMLYLASTGAAVKVGQARSWKFTIDKALDEDNALGDLWVTQKVGLLKFTGSISGNLDSGFTGAFDAAVATVAKSFYFYPDASTPLRFYSGQGHFKLDLEDTLQNVIRYTADFEGEGALAAA
jgi:hypothetical protein